MYTPLRTAAATAGVCLAALGLTGAAPPVHPVPLPFAAGEELNFRVSVGGMGTVGRGSMVVEAPVMVRNRRTLPLRFDFSTRVGPLRAEDHTRSWMDVERMTSMRFSKHERHPLSTHQEQVELFPSERRWSTAAGGRGTSLTDAPLDELSFLYFVRTLPLEPGREFEFNRHFEPARNPIGVRVLRRERVRVPAGEFETLVVQMTVRDPRRYRGTGTLRLFLSDDARRLPVRMESSLPVLGSMTLVLESVETDAGAARASR
jgi:hypothetical protein